MPLFGPYTDKVGPVISAAFCNALDVLQNAIGIDGNGGVTIGPPTSPEPALILQGFPGSGGDVLGVTGGPIEISAGALGGGIQVGQANNGIGFLNNLENQGFQVTGGPFLAAAPSGQSAAIGAAGNGLSPANALLLQVSAAGGGQLMFNGREIFRIFTGGGITVDAPLPGNNALFAVGVAGSAAVALTSPNTLNQSYGLYTQAGTSASDYAAIFYNAAAGPTPLFQIGGDGKLYGAGLYRRNQFPNVNAALDMTPDYGTFPGTLTGFTGTVQGTFYFVKMGQFVTIVLPTGITGTSNSVNMSLVGVPAELYTTSGAQSIPVMLINGSLTALGLVTVQSGGSYVFQSLTVGSGVLQPVSLASSGVKGLPSGACFTYAIL
jgi:hypothetical protein